MNVTENYLLQQMQTMAASIPSVPQTGTGKEKSAEGSSFQDMMDQAGKANTGKTAASKDSKPKESVEKEEAGELQKAPVKGEEKEELKPEQLTANPNAVSILDLFRPDVVQPVEEEPLIEVPVDAIAEESVEGPDLALDGQMPEMETGVEANVDADVSMEQQPKSFREALKEVPQQERQPVESSETAAVEAPEASEVSEAPQVVQAAEAAPEQQVENADKPQKAEAPEIEVQTDDEPKAEAAEIHQPLFREVRTAPMKVGEFYQTVNTQKPDMEQKLADTIQTAVQAGAEKVEIHLAPQNLGSLVIEMTKDANGALQVVLHATNTRAVSLLNHHLDGLQMALRGYSQEEVRIEVQHSGETQQQQHFKQADPDGRGQQQRQQQERREEKHTGDAFIQKLRLGLFGMDEI